MNNITQMQRKFIEEYIRTLDGEMACKYAGYTEKNLRETANRLLSEKKIILAIKSKLLSQINSLRVEKGYIVQKLLQIIEFSLEEEDITDKDGEATGKKKLRDTSTGLKALENLCKHIGFYSDHEESAAEAKIITISNLDKEKI
ncbi:terminase small subunit [bacterium]|nr:terminase small subunit [bacterium]